MPAVCQHAHMAILALADLVVALYPYPLSLVAIFHNGWALGEAHCKAGALMMGQSVIGSVFIITATTCYCYIVHSEAYCRVHRPWCTPPSTPATPGSSPQE
ncbi:hypothetical protein MC885_014658 [Smutsia gigantea]|nr:hypothetical protein MC885_014658 [Smutsia gigantea]